MFPRHIWTLKVPLTGENYPKDTKGKLASRVIDYYDDKDSIESKFYATSGFSQNDICHITKRAKSTRNTTDGKVVDPLIITVDAPGMGKRIRIYRVINEGSVFQCATIMYVPYYSKYETYVVSYTQQSRSGNTVIYEKRSYQEYPKAGGPWWTIGSPLLSGTISYYDNDLAATVYSKLKWPADVPTNWTDSKNTFACETHELALLKYPIFPSEILFDEYKFIWTGGDAHKTEVQFLDGDWQRLRASMAEAYLQAVNSLPTFSDNQYQNILEIATLLHSLLTGDAQAVIREFPETAHDLWLKYRYQFNTTKMDVQQGIDFLTSELYHNTYYDKTRVHGSDQFTTPDGVNVTVRCSMTIGPLYTQMTSDLPNYLYRWGLKPDLYILWDMIPFSFIVDWFVPAGEGLKRIDMENYAHGMRQHVSDVVFSISYTRETENSELTSYTRWLSSSIDDFLSAGYYWFVEDSHLSTNPKTWMKRALDIKSIFC